MNDTDVQYLAAIVRDSDDAIMGTTLDGIITSWNGGAERIYGYTAVEAIGQPVALIIPPDREDELPTILRKLTEGAGIDHYDTLRVTKDGRLVNISLTVSPIRDIAGAIIGASTIGRDVTQQKETENALRASARAYQLLMEQASDAILISYPDQRLLEVNERACEMLGYTRDEMLGLTENDIILPETFGASAPRLDHILDGKIVALDRPARCKDGTVIVAELSIRRLDDGRIVTIARDITARKRAEQLLQASEARYRAIVEDQTEFIARFRPDGTVTFVNEAVCRYLGRPRDDLLGRALYDLILPNDQPRVEHYFAAFSLEHTVATHERRTVNTDGTVQWIHWTIRALFNDEGNCTEFQSVGVDITGRRQAELQLQASEARYRQMFKANPSVQWLIDPETYAIVDANEAAQDFYGYSLDELKHMKATDVNVTVTPPEVARTMQRVLSGPASFIFKHKLASGEQRDVEAFSGPIDVDGRRLVYSIIHDVTARTRTEERLRKSEELYRALAHNLPNGAVLIFDRELRFQVADGRALQAKGFSKGLVEGRTLWEVLPPETSTALEPYYRAALAGQESVQDQEILGSFYRVHFLPIKDEQGTIFAGMVLTFDITEERQAERLRSANAALVAEAAAREQFGAELRESEERFRQLAETVGHVFWLTSPDGHEVIYANPAYAAVWGRPVSELIADPWSWVETLHPEDRERVMTDFGAKVSPSGFEDEYRIIRPDGVVRSLKVRRFPVLDAAGHTYRTVGIAEDITEVKRVAEERDRFFTLSPDLLCIADFNGSFLRLNPTWERTLGFTHAELLARPVVEWIHPDDRPATLAEMARLTAGHETLIFENRYLARDGTTRWLQWCATATVDTQRIYATAHDVTADKEARAALHQARDEANRANQAKSEFLSRMSHELRTPLNAILGFAQLLEMDNLSSAQGDSNRFILKAGSHLLNLINEVLDFARIEEGKLSISLESVFLRDLLRESLDLVQPLATDRQIELRADLDWMDDCYVLADRQRLRQVLLNLLANAIKYNYQAGLVTLLCAELVAPDGSRFVHLSVRDTGPGLTPDQVSRLFTPFERLGADQTGVEGTGLGLALARALVEAMGGTIGVTSEQGHGSTFWVDLAVTGQRNGGADLRQVPPSPPSRGPMPSRVVLYVEDNLSNVHLVEAILPRRPEITLLAAMQGEIGLDMAAAQQPDLILLDLHLPDMSGENVLRRLRADPRTATIPVVVISADANASRMATLIGLGARAYLTKPLDLVQFLATIDLMLQRGDP
ncbi:MAG: hypothetical protein NVS4B8_25930 [Herpetosiphon sp.]